MEPELVAGNPALDPLGQDLLDLDHRGQDLRLDQHRRRVEGQTSDIPDHQFLLDQAVWPGDEKANLGL
jgi:predicted ester cyclase